MILHGSGRLAHLKGISLFRELGKIVYIMHFVVLMFFVNLTVFLHLIQIMK